MRQIAPLAHLFGRLGAAMAIFCSAAAIARPPADQLLPATTKGFVSVPDVEHLLDAFDQIGIGRLLQQPSMEGFATDFQTRLTERFGVTGARVGITWDDLRGICAGEVAMAFVLTDDAKQRHSVVAIADATGKADEVSKLQQRIDSSMADRRAVRKTENWDGTTVTIYTVPIQQRGQTSFDAVVFTHDEFFVATDHPQVARDILGRVQNRSSQPNLSMVRAYQASMQRCMQEANDQQPHVRWFVEPLGYSELVRYAAGGRKRRKSDLIRALRKQGFEAVEGAGGCVYFNVPPYEILQRCFVYAPPIPGADETRYALAARMLHCHRIEDLSVERWVPSQINSYFCGTWDIQKSYQYIGSLVDEVAGDKGFWDDLKESLLLDENGPMIDLDKDIVAHLGTRVTAITDHQLPITTTSERFLVAIQLVNPAAMKASLAKALSSDPDAQRIPAGSDYEIWELKSETGRLPEAGDIEGGEDFGLEMTNPDYEGEGEENSFMANAALSVVEGHLLVASHKEFIQQLIDRVGNPAALADDADIQAIRRALKDIGADATTAEAFTRSDEQLRASYELIRQGKMPESESLIGKLLNQVLGPDERSLKREQQIDGSKLPDYEEVQPFLGPMGVYLRAEENGWFLAGIALPRAEKGATMGTREVETALKPGK